LCWPLSQYQTDIFVNMELHCYDQLLITWQSSQLLKITSDSAVPRRRVKFSYFIFLDPFSLVPRASGLFCAPELIFGGTEGAGSNFYVLRSRTHFRRYRGRRIQFSCFPLPDPFSTVLRHRVRFSTVRRASGPYMTRICAKRLT
jgi:hypothetical protein